MISEDDEFFAKEVAPEFIEGANNGKKLFAGDTVIQLRAFQRLTLEGRWASIVQAWSVRQRYSRAKAARISMQEDTVFAWVFVVDGRKAACAEDEPFDFQKGCLSRWCPVLKRSVGGLGGELVKDASKVSKSW